MLCGRRQVPHRQIGRSDVVRRDPVRKQRDDHEYRDNYESDDGQAIHAVFN
jgi:hypothetical protein